MTHPKDRRTLAQREAVRRRAIKERAKNIQKLSMTKAERRKKFMAQSVFVVILIAVIATAALYLFPKL